MQRTHRIARLILAVLAAAAIAYPAAALAQPHRVSREAAPRTPRVHFGGGLQIMQAVGAFSDSIDAGIGGGFNVRYHLDRRGILSLRGDVGATIYGNERRRIPFPGAPRVSLEQNTNNGIVHYAVGPQLMWPTGPLRPYVSGFVGGSYFNTSTSLEGTANDGQPFATSENHHDNNLSYGGVAGLYIPIRSVGRSRSPLAIDLGARYAHNGTARYLKPGSIVDGVNGYTVRPIESAANFMVYTIGVSVGAVSDGRRRR